MLARINWIFFTKREHYDERLRGLAEAIRYDLLHAQTDREPAVVDGEEQAEVLNVHIIDENRVLSSKDRGEEGEESEDLARPPVIPPGGLCCDFWDRHFGTKTEASWIEFKEKFLADYSEKISKHFGQDKEKWAIHLIYKDIFELHKTVDKTTYTRFCGKNTKADPHLFFNRFKGLCYWKFCYEGSVQHGFNSKTYCYPESW